MDKEQHSFDMYSTLYQSPNIIKPTSSLGQHIPSPTGRKYRFLLSLVHPRFRSSSSEIRSQKENLLIALAQLNTKMPVHMNLLLAIAHSPSTLTNHQESLTSLNLLLRKRSAEALDLYLSNGKSEHDKVYNTLQEAFNQQEQMIRAWVNAASDLARLRMFAFENPELWEVIHSYL
ncbi:MAG: hypothetical protein L6R40_002001 [Gallowayella cf. fulva]|nr:MAG: hypothetical protein L6R40_002001 [Xanthomendoza cf. fulva]